MDPVNSIEGTEFSLVQSEELFDCYVSSDGNIRIVAKAVYVPPASHSKNSNSYLPTIPMMGGRKANNVRGVYLIYSELAGKIYVGSSQRIWDRISKHKSKLRTNSHHSPIMQAAWKKYGESSFTFCLLEVVADHLSLNDAEQAWINMLAPQFNCCTVAGRTTGYKHSEETRKKMRERHADVSGQNNPMYGVRLTGSNNHMHGSKREDTSRFNRETKKGKTWEQMYGVERAKEMKEALRIKMNGNKYRRDAV